MKADKFWTDYFFYSIFNLTVFYEIIFKTDIAQTVYT